MSSPPELHAALDIRPLVVLEVGRLTDDGPIGTIEDLAHEVSSGEGDHPNGAAPSEGSDDGHDPPPANGRGRKRARRGVTMHVWTEDQMLDLVRLFGQMYDKHTSLVATIPPADLLGVYQVGFEPLLAAFPSLVLVDIKQMSAKYTLIVDHWTKIKNDLHPGELLVIPDITHRVQRRGMSPQLFFLVKHAIEQRRLVDVTSLLSTQPGSQPPKPVAIIALFLIDGTRAEFVARETLSISTWIAVRQQLEEDRKQEDINHRSNTLQESIRHDNAKSKIEQDLESIHRSLQFSTRKEMLSSRAAFHARIGLSSPFIPFQHDDSARTPHN